MTVTTVLQAGLHSMGCPDVLRSVAGFGNPPMSKAFNTPGNVSYLMLLTMSLVTLLAMYHFILLAKSLVTLRTEYLIVTLLAKVPRNAPSKVPYTNPSLVSFNAPSKGSCYAPSKDPGSSSIT